MGHYPAAFAPTELFVVLLSSYFGNHDSGFLIIVPDQVPVSLPVEKYVQSVGGRIMTASEAKKLDKDQVPGHLWVHPFGKAHISTGLIEKFGAQYSVYSDGIKNELGKANLEEVFPDYKELLFFGFVWKRPFIKNGAPVRVCTFRDIDSAFDALKSIVGAKLSFDSDDLKKDWLFLRYWGQGPGEFVDGLRYIDVIKRYLSTEDVSSVVLKGDSRIMASSTDDVLAGLKGDYDVVALEDRVEFTKADSLEVDKFFAEVMIPHDFSGRLHCFDSSLSVYAAVATEATIRFPREELVTDVFANAGFARNVISYAGLYRSVCEKVRELRDADAFKIDDALVVERGEGGFSVREAHCPTDKAVPIEKL
ncbi:hypothetical protein D5687_10965 [Guyparkeria sp. SCN-R1]|uniref:hypothetical protein n=1 Tax=Guyparkeria sp. SCN-R1 TaxID=2341113 RepID=UPI000F6471C8|nr:hypothetical protein [Guyparkeria sp. SCN-R1]RRQ19907.1 hypothetical protein D5687_10965 [Guyparkeria sp. SCN-R1]